MQLKDGAMLQNDKYRIIRVIGQGGFGITYLAENLLLGRMVAIKEFFPKDFCGRDNTSHLTLGTQNNAETVEKLRGRFLKEARNIARLDHPGIVKIHDVFEENNTAYYVMDFIDGENLNEMVRREGPLSEAKAIDYIRKVGDALDYIHSRNMTHFDVKPANIMVRRTDNQPVLVDFGLSKQYDRQGGATSTLMPAVSQGYSPIELYNPATLTSFSPQTDIYSLGATLYFLVTGKVPTSAIEAAETGFAIPSMVSTQTKSAIESATQFSRTKRPQHVTSFLESLHSLQEKKQKPSSGTANGSQAQKEEADSTRLYEEATPPRYKERATNLAQEMDQEMDNVMNHLGISKDKISKTNNQLSGWLPVIVLVIGILIWAAIFAIVNYTSSSTTTDSLVDKQEIVENTPNPVHSTPKGIEQHDYVDLGLPSGIKWATCNLGADSPSDFGDYYTWGEASPKSYYYETPAIFSGKRLSELCSEGILDSNGNLTPEYDAAHVNWGGNWRIPTTKEWRELLNKCTWVWGRENEHYGYEVTGPNGKTIFLPITGWAIGNRVDYIEPCYYFSSTLNRKEDSRGNQVHDIIILGSDKRKMYIQGIGFGHTIRPVTQ